MEEVKRFILNKSLDDIGVKKTLAEYEHRIVRKDGVDFIVTDDFNPIRLNLSVFNNIITFVGLG
jgi:hypothetical protein